MRELVAQYLSHSISRRRFVNGLTKAGLTATAANSVLGAVTSAAHAQTPATTPVPYLPAQAAAGAAGGAPGGITAGVKPFQGTGGAAFAEQLIACGVKYVFGNSASEDAQFYEALVDRPQLKYILTPHEGPGAAMASGYIKASSEPAMVMQAGVVGMVNAMGQIFNAWKEQTPLVVYSYRTDQTRRAGRDGFEEAANQEQIAQPITKFTWLARRPDMIPETVRHAFKAAWTPPFGPSYISWHSDYNDDRVRTDIIAQQQFDPRMRVRPNPDEVTRAAKLLVEAKKPLMIVGDEIYKAKAARKAAKLAELLGMPVTQVQRQLYANFPRRIRCGSATRLPSTSTRWRGRRTPTSSSMSATSSSTMGRRRSCRAGRNSSTCASTMPAWALSCSPRCRWSPMSASASTIFMPQSSS